MIPIPLLAAGLQLLNTVMSGDQKADEEIVVEVLGTVAKLTADKPFWKSKRFLAGAITTILLMINKRIGLDLGLEEIGAIAGVVSVYIASKSYEQK